MEFCWHRYWGLKRKSHKCVNQPEARAAIFEDGPAWNFKLMVEVNPYIYFHTAAAEGNTTS